MFAVADDSLFDAQYSPKQQNPPYTARKRESIPRVRYTIKLLARLHTTERKLASFPVFANGKRSFNKSCYCMCNLYKHLQDF